jgi:hypothetical protein
MTRLALVVAPLLLLAYGAVRLLDPNHSPGAVWTASHLFYLLMFPAFACAALALRRLLDGRWRTVGTVLVGVGWLGAFAGMGQAAIDLAAGWGAPDKAARSLVADQLRETVPGAAYFYGIWPSLTQIAVFGLLVLAATGRRVPLWAPPLALVALLLPTVTSLDLIPVAALGVLPALLPAYRRLGDRAHVPSGAI